MSWHLFRVTYELLSPLHVGHLKIASVQTSRYCVPARSLWAAVTVRLVRSELTPTSVSKGDFRQIAEWVKQHCAFSYLFLLDGDLLLHPSYTNGGLRYGTMSEPEFERRFLSAHVTTALDAATRSAEDGSLHEVEFIAPHEGAGRRTQLSGFVWLDEIALSWLGGDNWRTLLNELQLGGERRYGFGRVKLSANGYEVTDRLPVDCAIQSDASRPRLKLQKDQPLLAHTLTTGVQARGMIEPLVGRETRDGSRSFGRVLTDAQICWVPGSLVTREVNVELQSDGTWKSVKAT